MKLVSDCPGYMGEHPGNAKKYEAIVLDDDKVVDMPIADKRAKFTARFRILYAPFIPRLRFLIAHPVFSILLRYGDAHMVNADANVVDDIHQAEIWRRFAALFPLFSEGAHGVCDVRIAVGIYADSASLSKHKQSHTFSVLPTLLSLANLPVWLRSKEELLLLSALPPMHCKNPKLQLGNRIHALMQAVPAALTLTRAMMRVHARVHLEPLIDEFLELAFHGVKMMDGSKVLAGGEPFEVTVRGAPLCTSTDYPATMDFDGCTCKGNINSCHDCFQRGQKYSLKPVASQAELAAAAAKGSKRKRLNVLTKRSIEQVDSGMNVEEDDEEDDNDDDDDDADDNDDDDEDEHSSSDRHRHHQHQHHRQCRRRRRRRRRRRGMALTRPSFWVTCIG